MEDIKIFDENGGYNPYKLSWGQTINFPSTRSLSEYGNRVYNRYPARSIFLVPRAILSAHQNKGLNVLDPFMGSGTTAVETVISGNIPFGTEMDPFARMIAEVSSTIFTIDDFNRIQIYYETIVLTWNNYKPAPVPDLIGIERWFKGDDLSKLLQLYCCIEKNVPAKYRPFFVSVYADCIKPVSKMERQSTKPYISTKYQKVTKDVLASFEYSYNAHYKALYQMSNKLDFIQQPSICWLGDDATNINAPNVEIDMAITSPPYINAFDYSQCIKVESAMSGYMDKNSISTLRLKQVGHANRRKQQQIPEVYTAFEAYYDQLIEKDKMKAGVCLAYFCDIYKNLKCVYNLLRDGGEYHMIIGDSVIKGVNIPTHQITAMLAEMVGYEWFGYYNYLIKDHRTSIPRDFETSKIKVEHVIMLRK